MSLYLAEQNGPWPQHIYMEGNGMFRELRRRGQALPEEEVERILREGTYGVLSVTDADGWPYGVPINYFYEDGCLYMHCGKEGHKIECLKHDDRASFCVVGSDRINAPKLSTDFQSVICFGRGSFVAGEAEREEIVRKFTLHLAPGTTEEALGKEISVFGRNLVILKLKIEHVTGKEGKYLSLARKKAAK